MYSVKQIEAGVLKYVDKELMPNLLTTGEQMLNHFCSSRTAQVLGIVSPEGLINIDVVRSVALNFIPPEGKVFTFAGASIRFTRDDIETLCRMIKEG